MNLERFTERAQQAVVDAQQTALEFHHAYIEPAHILRALLRQEQGVAAQVIAGAGGNPQALESELDRELGGMPKVGGDSSQIGLSRQGSEALSEAEREAAAMKDEYVSTEHILLALSETLPILRKHNLGKDVLLKALNVKLPPPPNPDGSIPPSVESEKPKKNAIQRQTALIRIPLRDASSLMRRATILVEATCATFDGILIHSGQ